MITVEDNIYLDYQETAKALHCTLTYVRELVSKKILSSKQIGYSKKKYIALSDIKQRLLDSHKDVTVLSTIEQTNLNIDTALTSINHYPIRSQSLEAIELVQTGYSKLSEDLKESLEPLIRTVKDTDTENFIKIVSQFMQSIMNRLYSLPNDKPIRSFTPMEFMLYVFQDIDMPENIKYELLKQIIQMGDKTYEQLNKTQNDSKTA